MMKRFVSILLFCLTVLLSQNSSADAWPAVIRLAPSVVCDTEDQATEILEMYQSSGIDAALKILNRLIQERNQYNDSKCVVTPGIFLVIKETQRMIIQHNRETTTGVILEVFHPVIKTQVFVIVIVDSKPSF